MQLGQLAQAESTLVAMGYQILAVSPDRPEMLKASIAKNELDYTLLSDSPMDAARAFGLAFELDAETLRIYDGYGLDLEGASGQPHHQLPVPAAFVVSKDGTIQYSYMNPNHAVRVQPEVLLAAAKAAIGE